MNSCQFGTRTKMECSIWEFQSHNKLRIDAREDDKGRSIGYTTKYRKGKHGVNMDVLRLESKRAQPDTHRNSVDFLRTQFKNNELRRRKGR